MERLTPDPAGPLDPKNREWVGLGDQVEVNPGRQEAAEDDFAKAYNYAVKSQTHLWTVTIVHRASVQMLEAFTDRNPSNIPILDHESILMRPAIGCYVCEEPFDPRLRLRKCPGEPTYPARR